MNIKDDVKKVMGELQKSVDANGEIDLFFMLQEVINLFERVKDVLPSTNAQERKELFATMTELQHFLIKETGRLAEKSGLSAEQLARFSENPDNFNKEQWSLLGEVKTKLGRQADDIRGILKTLPPIPGEEGVAPQKKPAHKKAKKGRRKAGKKAQMRA